MSKEKKMKTIYKKAVFMGMKVKSRMEDMMENEAGMGTVEVILIIMVLIGLVIIFKSQLTGLVDDIFEKIVKQAKTI